MSVAFCSLIFCVVANDRKISDAAQKLCFRCPPDPGLLPIFPFHSAKLLACRGEQHVTCINAIFIPQHAPKIRTAPLLKPPMNVIPKQQQQRQCNSLCCCYCCCCRCSFCWHCCWSYCHVRSGRVERYFSCMCVPSWEGVGRHIAFMSIISATRHVCTSLLLLSTCCPPTRGHYQTENRTQEQNRAKQNRASYTECSWYGNGSGCDHLVVH